MKLRRGAPAPLLVLGLAAAGGAGADDLYAVRGDRGGTVITNVPPDADRGRPLYGGSEQRPREPATARPETAPRLRPYSDLVGHVARRYGLDQDLVHAVISVESGYDPGAVSPKGAVGLMQLMPETAAGVGIHDLTDPHDNILGGVRHLRRLLDRYDGDLTRALAAYNAGAAAVDRYGGVPPFRETRDYIRRVRSRYRGAGNRADAADPIYAFVDEHGTLVLTQFPPAGASAPPPSATSR